MKNNMTNSKIKEKAKEICEENYPFCSDCPFSDYTGYDEEGNPDCECIFNCSNDEKLADEMFKELGYEKIVDDENRIIYDNNVDLNEDIYNTRIIFKNDLKEIKFSVNEISLGELQAINQQCKELGWL